MKIFAIFVISFLFCRPTFGDEHHAATGSKTSSAHSESEGMESDDGNKSGDSETGESMRSDDDNNSMNTNGGNDAESDDMGTGTAPLRSVGGATTSAVLRQLHDPSATTAVSAGAAADTQQILDQLFSTADSRKAIGASAAILGSAMNGSMTGGNEVSAMTNNLVLNASSGPSTGKVSANSAPEPATGVLLAMSALPWILGRRR